ncbi:lactonase family protein [Flammeovirgaceae bacterium SG7u.111]|nr:lactonase family protein [Flammeovirgaceae bacterium SG7u.132]WPO34133.1 lactonase family protein [Flammeovirgaceae bacterium SG7u.111]
MKLYAGSYTEFVGDGLEGHGEGIYVFEFEESDGFLKLLFKGKNRNTSYLSLNEDKKLLYTFQELSEDKSPKLLTYSIQDNNLELLHEQEIEGGLPCHLQKLKNHDLLAVACYQTGNVVLFPLDEKGMPQPAVQNIRHEGSSVNKVRQEAPHAHMAYSNPRGLVYVPDLGIDKIMVYQVVGGKLKRVDQIEVPMGRGPRHIDFHPSNKYAFVMNELTGDVSLLKNDGRKFRWEKNLLSLPKALEEDAASSAIKVDRSGQFIYCGDRSNHCISILKFDIETESLTLAGNQETFGKTPRDFTLSPSGKWLIAANQDSDSIVVFEVDKQSGLLTKTHENKEAASVVCLKF